MKRADRVQLWVEEAVSLTGCSVHLGRVQVEPDPAFNRPRKLGYCAEISERPASEKPERARVHHVPEWRCVSCGLPRIEEAAGYVCPVCQPRNTTITAHTMNQLVEKVREWSRAHVLAFHVHPLDRKAGQVAADNVFNIVSGNGGQS